MKVHEALQQLKDNGPTFPRSGICINVGDLLLDYTDAASYAAWFEKYPQAVSAWAEFSGRQAYPVPVGRSKRCPQTAYQRREGLWTGEYGAARLRLLQHLIDWFKERDL